MTKTKQSTILLYFILALAVMFFSTTMSNLLFEGVGGLVAAGITVLAAIPVHILAKKNNVLYLVSFVMNSVANGVAMSAYYVSGDNLPDVVDMLAFSLPALALVVFCYMMLTIDQKGKKLTLILSAAVGAIMLAWFGIMWAMGEGIGFSYGFFALVLALCYLAVMGVSVGNDERNVLRDVSFGSFGALIIIIVIVIVVLSDGDGIDVVGDFGGDGKKIKRKK